MMSKYSKALLALVISAIGVLVTALGTGGGTFSSVDGKHWIIAGLAILGSGAFTAVVETVHGVAGGVIKMVVATLTAGFGSLVIALNDNHITQIEWLTAAGAAVAALAAVYQVKTSQAATPNPAGTV